jgi:hypothetical protein
MSGCISATKASNSTRSLDNVLSAPTDFRNPVGSDLAIIDPSRDPVIVRAGVAEICLHELERLVTHVQTGEWSELIHLRACGRSDDVKFPDE